MMKYSYGSHPIGNYTCIDFVRYLAPVSPVNDQVFYWQGSLQWRDNDNIPLDLFKNICHWKSQRRFRLVLNVQDNELQERWRAALRHLNQQELQDENIQGALQELIRLQGIGIPMASALLTAWNPRQFGIVDFRTLVVLGMRQDDARNGISIPDYINFRNNLLRLQQDHNELHACALRQIELAFWHYYPICRSGYRNRA
ncbi:MAG: hypothetical protein NTX52_07260 [Planctomycetota bacterium]|nr:hypothetical protein [Planctomycetota bacterium]